jgi:CheY-like chemotaxis protein
MKNKRPLIIVEDDVDDQELLMHVLKELRLTLEVKVFDNGLDALEYLKNGNVQPFLILSDVNMPMMDGITLKREIEKSLVLKKLCIPFVFISTSPAVHVKQLGDLNVQGYFEKGNSMEQLNDTLKTILKYWNLTRHLN